MPYREPMIRRIAVGTIGALAVLSLAFATQDITLKKLYDPIEDFQAEYRLSTTNNGTFVEPKLSIDEQNAVKNQVVPALEAYLKRVGRWGVSIQKPNHEIEERCSYKQSDITDRVLDGVTIAKLHTGSFTQRNHQQRLYTFAYCLPWEGPGAWIGSMIFEAGTLIAVYAEPDEDGFGSRFSVTDINQNGINEFMLVVPEKQNYELYNLQLLELPNANVRNLGDISIGIVPTVASEIFPSKICAENLLISKPVEMFSSSKIFVLKASSPLFFSERYNVNCDYLKTGVKARKVQDLKPITPVLRPSRFTRIF